MARILVRAHKHPLTAASAEATLTRNLIGNNTGNLVFSQAVFRLLSIEGNQLSTARLVNDRAEQINAEFDHVVIPLANAFRISFLDSLNAMTDIIERLTVPVTVVGVGAQASLAGSLRSADRVGPAVQRFVRAALQRSPSIGVRGEFTQDFLKNLGFGDSEVEVIGCPSMFMFGPHLQVAKRTESLGPDARVALNISPYVRAMGAISLDHADRYPNLDYIAQDHLTLALLLRGSYPSEKVNAVAATGVPVTLDHPLIRQDRVRFFLDPHTWFEHLGRYDFSFGSRIHGNISALLAGTPAVVLAHDSRTRELADYHQIPWRPVEAGRPVDAAQLFAESDWAPLNQAHPSRWERFTAFLAHHRLTQAYETDQSPARFDAALAGTEFPPPVRTLMGTKPEELYAMKRELLELQAEQREAARRNPLRRLARAARRRLG